MTEIGGRDCGNCTACCEFLVIDCSDLKKPAGKLCQLCTGNSCDIYQARPAVCRDYYCGWQQISSLGDDWRPDNSGVLLLPVEAVPDSSIPQGMEFMILGGEAAVRRPQFAGFLTFLVSCGAPVYMTVAGRRALLNPSLESAVAARNYGLVRQLLLRLYAGATTHSDSKMLPPL